MKSLKKVVVGIIIVSFLFVFGRLLHIQIAYAQIEKMTQDHAATLSKAVNACIASVDATTAQKVPGLVSETSVEYFKVFDYSETEAKVFVVTQDKLEKPGLLALDDGYGQFCYLVSKDGAWIPDPEKLPEVVWSKAGSAHGETWPPYY